MIPYKLDITIRRGDTKEIFFRVRNKVWNETTSTWEAGGYKDLTGYTIASQIRQTKSASTVLLEFTVTIGNQAEPVNGLGAVLLKIPGTGVTGTGSVPTNIPAGVWDVQFTEADGDPFTYIEGDVTFTEDVTR